MSTALGSATMNPSGPSATTNSHSGRGNSAAVRNAVSAAAAPAGQRYQPDRGTVRTAATRATATPRGSRSGCRDRWLGVEPHRRVRAERHGRPTTGWRAPGPPSRRGAGASTNSEPTSGTRGTAYHAVGPAAATTAQSSVAAAAASVIAVGPSSRTGQGRGERSAPRPRRRRRAGAGRRGRGPRPRAAAPAQRPRAGRCRGRRPTAPRSVGYAVASVSGQAHQSEERQESTGRRGPRQHHRAECPADDRESGEREHRERCDELELTVRSGREHRQGQAEGSGHLGRERAVRAGRQSPSETARSTAPSMRGTRRRRGRRASRAFRAPNRSTTTSPSATVVRASAATPRSRRASHWPASAVATVSPTSTAVRPPMPSQDQATARKMTAATSRQVAPSPSRIFGTEAALRPRQAPAGGRRRSGRRVRRGVRQHGRGRERRGRRSRAELAAVGAGLEAGDHAPIGPSVRPPRQRRRAQRV